MVAKLSNQSQTIGTTARLRSVSRAGFIQTYAGATAPQGWAICDGAVLEQADYQDLFANIGSTWDSFAHPVDGTPTVGVGPVRSSKLERALSSRRWRRRSRS